MSSSHPSLMDSHISFQLHPIERSRPAPTRDDDSMLSCGLVAAGSPDFSDIDLTTCRAYEDLDPMELPPSRPDQTAPGPPTVAKDKYRPPCSSIAYLWRWWYLEILACCVSTAALVAQILVLYRFDGKPQDTWPSTTLTLNGFIAILATLCRGSLMVPVASCLSQAKWTRYASVRGSSQPFEDFQILDEASKGSWGGLQVLWRFKGISSMSCLGALITIASLALGTFAQQLIVVRTAYAPILDATQDQIAPVPIAMQMSPITVPNTSELSPYVRRGIHAAFFDLETPSLRLHCTTGVCMWPIYSTIGMCGSCKDINTHIDLRQVPSVGNPTGFQASLPNGLVIGDVSTVSSGAENIMFSVNASGLGPPSQKIEATLITQLTMLGFRNGSTTIDEMLATECSMWVCLQSRQIIENGGKQNDRLLSPSSRIMRHDKTSGLEDDILTFTESDYSTKPTMFHVKTSDIVALRNHLQGALRGNIIQQSQNPQGVYNYSSSYTEAIFGSFTEFYAVESWLGRLTEGMTHALRTSPDATTERTFITGSVLKAQVYIIVRYQWLLYPAVLVFLTIIYLDIEIARTSYHRLPPWKSDSLVSLYTKLSIDERLYEQAASGLHTPYGLGQAVGNHKVRLKFCQERGARFIDSSVAREEERILIEQGMNAQ